MEIEIIQKYLCNEIDDPLVYFVLHPRILQTDILTNENTERYYFKWKMRCDFAMLNIFEHSTEFSATVYNSRRPLS